jgi:cytochrome c-type protein NapB
MFYKKLLTATLVGSITTLSVSAMDMDMVNALAQQIKSGTTIDIKQKKSDTQINQTTTQPTTSTSSTKTITEESLGLRKTDLYSENSDTVGEETKYIKDSAGSSKKFDRAYENAPPLIPHDVEGMLPIKIGNNACTGCHLPDVAKSVGATPIPASHFASFRPVTSVSNSGEIIKEGQTINNTSDIKMVVHKLNDLSNARFNCSQCHVPQSTQEPLVKNTFEGAFRNDNGLKRSNLLETIDDGVK